MVRVLVSNMKVSYTNKPYQHRVSLGLTLVKINTLIDLDFVLGLWEHGTPLQALEFHGRSRGIQTVLFKMGICLDKHWLLSLDS